MSDIYHLSLKLQVTLDCCFSRLSFIYSIFGHLHYLFTYLSFVEVYSQCTVLY